MDETFFWWARTLLHALVGAFGTAFVHEKTSRDVNLGGWIGLVMGGFFGLPGLVSFWVWLIYDKRTWRITIQNPRRRWFSWWLP